MTLSIIKIYTDQIAAHKALVNDTALIFSWGNGLAVRFSPEGEAQAVGVTTASVVQADDHRVGMIFNGKNEVAKLVTRGDAARAELADLQATFKTLMEA